MLYFAAINAANGDELWRSDGTAVGTTLLKDIWVGGGDDGSDPFNLEAIDENVYFSADDGTTGRELWRTDGTTAGTVLVQDIAPGYSTTKSDPLNFVKSGQRVFFVADNDSVGPEVWALPLATLPPQAYIPLVQR